MLPNVTNVIPKQVKAQLDIRHGHLDQLIKIVSTLIVEAKSIAASRGVQITSNHQIVQVPRPLDQN